ncbi:SET and MYND domain-containing protein 4-like isoform X2 [Lineus longissimus]|uniref:SET and MYND domain-containing protein 4-like isoform X2 n=1 Tax=Lineus longissimus TaxID=88925 RepID=UPI00315C4F31
MSIQEVPWVNGYFSEVPRRKSTKWSTKSHTLRSDGNKQFQRKNYRQAVETYTKSILNAPIESDGKEQSLGFANRSAALFHLQEYQMCLDDIAHALEASYPDHLQYKLYQRKGQCLIELHKFEEARQALVAALESIGTATSLTPERQESVKKEVLQLLDQVLREENDAPPEDKNMPTEVPVISYGPSSTITQATRAVGLGFNEDQGRHLVAVDSIQTGDTLIVEQPFSAVLLPSHYDTHCHHCFKPILAPIGCDLCTDVRFCSQDCKSKSWETYHQYECGYLNLFHSVGIAHLSLRIVLTAGLQYLLESKDDYKSTEQVPGLTKEGVYDFGYPSVYHLMPHSDKMKVEDVFQYTMTAVLLLKCLVHCQFFPESDMDATLDGAFTLSPDKQYIGGLLLRHIQQLVCNAHAITGLKPDVNLSSTADVETVSQVRIATAIYPTASLMNHSCKPNIISSFHNDMLVVRATREIPKGEQVYNCYGPHHKKMNTSERQQILKDQYFFSCKCEPCQQREDRSFYQALKCPDCSGPLSLPKPDMVCEECGRVACDSDKMLEKVVLAHNMFVYGVTKLEKNDIGGALSELHDCLKLREAVMYRHNKDLAEVQDVLARCYATSENFLEAAKYLKRSIQTIKKMFGSRSIELGNELHKLAQILFNDHKEDEALMVIKKALKILTSHYGSSHPVTKDLLEMQTCLLDVK